MLCIYVCICAVYVYTCVCVDTFTHYLLGLRDMRKRISWLWSFPWRVKICCWCYVSVLAQWPRNQGSWWCKSKYKVQEDKTKFLKSQELKRENSFPSTFCANKVLSSMVCACCTKDHYLYHLQHSNVNFTLKYTQICLYTLKFQPNILSSTYTTKNN